LETAGIITRCRGGGVRISPHGYAIRDEVDRLIDEVRAIMKR
jgi:selenocysteine lyase/cysteine desulfurase